MYARFSTFSVVADTDPDTERAFADAVTAVLRQQPGFVSVVFFGTTREQHALSVWQTRTQAEAAGTAIAAWLEAGGWSDYTRLTRTPVTRIMSAYIPAD